MTRRLFMRSIRNAVLGLAAMGSGALDPMFGAGSVRAVGLDVHGVARMFDVPVRFVGDMAVWSALDWRVLHYGMARRDEPLRLS